MEVILTSLFKPQNGKEKVFVRLPLLKAVKEEENEEKAMEEPHITWNLKINTVASQPRNCALKEEPQGKAGRRW